MWGLCTFPLFLTPFFWALRFPPAVHSNAAILTVCACPATDWVRIQDGPQPCPSATWARLQACPNPDQDKQIDDGWLDGYAYGTAFSRGNPILKLHLRTNLCPYPRQAPIIHNKAWRNNKLIAMILCVDIRRYNKTWQDIDGRIILGVYKWEEIVDFFLRWGV